MRDGEEFILSGTEFTLGSRLAVESDGQYFDAVQHGVAVERGSSLEGLTMDVAMKISSDAAQDRLLVNEARLLHLLTGHPSTLVPRRWVCLSEYGDKRSVLVLDRWDATLAELLVNGASCDWRCAHYVGLSVLRGLESTHRLGWLHGNVAPRSVVLDRFSQVKLFGFGYAVRFPAVLSGDGADRFAYLSPEALRGELCDERADLWSVGVLLYRMLTGSLPWPIEASGRNEYPPLPALPVELAPAPMLNVVRRLLENDRNARFASAREASDALFEVDTSYPQFAIETLKNAAIGCRASRLVDSHWENQRVVFPPASYRVIRTLS
jgi:serine/threonine protein kinase